MKTNTLLLTASLGLATAPGAWASTVLYDNGPLITHPGQGYGGADASAITVGLNTYGFGMNAASPLRLADDFTVAAGQTWNLTAIRLYGYQTGSGTTSTFSSLAAQIWNGRPGDLGAAVVWGNLTDNLLASSSFSGIYRVNSTTPYTDNTRPIMELAGTVSTSLTAGTYWLEWATTGSLASGPWNPPVSIAGQPITGNARQYNVSAWQDTLSETYQQDLPFQIVGEVAVVPEPSQWAMMGMTLLGAGGFALRQWRSRRAK